MTTSLGLLNRLPSKREARILYSPLRSIRMMERRTLAQSMSCCRRSYVLPSGSPRETSSSFVPSGYTRRILLATSSLTIRKPAGSHTGPSVKPKPDATVDNLESRSKSVQKIFEIRLQFEFALGFLRPGAQICHRKDRKQQDRRKFAFHLS